MQPKTRKPLSPKQNLKNYCIYTDMKIYLLYYSHMKRGGSQVSKLNLDTLCINTSELLLRWQIPAFMPWMINTHLELSHDFVACDPRVPIRLCLQRAYWIVLLFHLKIEEINSISEKNQRSPKLCELIM